MYWQINHKLISLIGVINLSSVKSLFTIRYVEIVMLFGFLGRFFGGTTARGAAADRAHYMALHLTEVAYQL